MFCESVRVRFEFTKDRMEYSFAGGNCLSLIWGDQLHMHGINKLYFIGLLSFTG